MDYAGTGHMIAEARREKGMTQKQLAERLHVSDRTVSKWECGKGFPDPALLEPLADALQIPLADIVCGTSTDIRADEDTRLREMFGILRRETRRRSIKIFKRLLLTALIVLIAESVVFSLRTGGDGLRRWQWVRYFRENYEMECGQYKERGVYRMEWISGDRRTVITDDAAIDGMLSILQDMELGKEYKDWGIGAVKGYLTVAVDDGEMEDSAFVLSFPAFTISAAIGESVGRQFCYEAAVNDMGAYEAVEAAVQQLVKDGKAESYQLGVE